MARNESQPKLAVLIDADNTPAAIIEGLLAEIAKLGVSSVKRIYGDWTNPHLKGWKDVLLTHAIQPIQQFGYTVGKSATDTAMIIDAMDLLYTEKLDGFCIVSSDSDFTRLASRLREAGMAVIGFGEKKTPKAFVGACDRFIYTEILRKEAPGPTRGPAAPSEHLEHRTPPAARSNRPTSPSSSTSPQRTQSSICGANPNASVMVQSPARIAPTRSPATTHSISSSAWISAAKSSG